MEEAFSNSEHYSDKNFWNERFQKYIPFIYLTYNLLY